MDCGFGVEGESKLCTQTKSWKHIVRYPSHFHVQPGRGFSARDRRMEAWVYSVGGRGGSQGTRIKAVFREQIRKWSKQCKRWAVQRGEVQTEATTGGRETMEIQAQGILKATGVDVMCSPHPQRSVHQRKSLRMEPGENQCLLKDRRLKRSFKGGSNSCSGSQDPTLSSSCWECWWLPDLLWASFWDLPSVKRTTMSKFKAFPQGQPTCNDWWVKGECRGLPSR